MIKCKYIRSNDKKIIGLIISVKIIGLMIKCKYNRSNDNSVKIIGLIIKCKDNWSNNKV